MPETLISLLTTREAIASAATVRRKPHTEKTITGATSEIREQKAALELQDGWSVLRRGKMSLRLKRDKPIDEQLEDSVWTVLSQMGFDEMSDGRGFTIDFGDGNNPRQIDVFAKDCESVVIVECTTCETPKPKSLRELIDKILALQKPVGDAIRSHYGREHKLKVRWAIATRNVEWGEADLQKAETSKITVLRETELAYYEKLVSHLKVGARYQFLGHLFKDEEVAGLGIQVPATKGRMGKRTFYNFLIHPNDLLKIAYVSHRGSRDSADLDTYQRMLKPKRLKEIGAYVDKGGQFPTNIVINMRSRKGLRFECREKVGEDTAFGMLNLPNRYACCWVIDGQHRLYGYAQSKRSEKNDDRTTVPVLAYDSLPPTEEAGLFVDINCEQVRVTKRLLNELYANLRWDSDVFSERMDALAARIVGSLNQTPSSPLYDKIIVSNRDKSPKRCLTMTSFIDGLTEGSFFGREDRPGPLMYAVGLEENRLEASRAKGVGVLKDYFDLFRSGMSQGWELGDARGGYVCTNNGIRALLMVLSDILRHISKHSTKDCDLLTAEDLKPEIARLAGPVVELLGAATDVETEEFRSRQALKGVTRNALLMMSCINRSDSAFLPDRLAEYLQTIDEEGTHQAEELIDELQKTLFEYVITELKRAFSGSSNPKAWWFEGIPEKVRLECQERCELERGVREPQQYICLINYRDIAKYNWPLLEPLFSLGEKAGKEKGTEWLCDLNTVRNITHHREKWPATKEQVKKVKEIVAKFRKRFAEVGQNTSA